MENTNTVLNDRIGFSVNTVVLSKIPIYQLFFKCRKETLYDDFCGVD